MKYWKKAFVLWSSAWKEKSKITSKIDIVFCFHWYIFLFSIMGRHHASFAHVIVCNVLINILPAIFLSFSLPSCPRFSVHDKELKANTMHVSLCRQVTHRYTCTWPLVYTAHAQGGVVPGQSDTIKKKKERKH